MTEQPLRVYATNVVRPIDGRNRMARVVTVAPSKAVAAAKLGITLNAFNAGDGAITTNPSEIEAASSDPDAVFYYELAWGVRPRDIVDAAAFTKAGASDRQPVQSIAQQREDKRKALLDRANEQFAERTAVRQAAQDRLDDVGDSLAANGLGRLTADGNGNTTVSVNALLSALGLG